MRVWSIFIVEIRTIPTLILEGTNSVFVSLFCEFDHGGRLTSPKKQISPCGPNILIEMPNM